MTVCVTCCQRIVKVSPGFSRGRPVEIQKCLNGHKQGRFLAVSQIDPYLYESAQKPPFTGSLKSFGYYGDHVKEWYPA